MKRLSFIMLYLLVANILSATPWNRLQKKYPTIDFSRVYEIYEPGSLPLSYTIEDGGMFKRDTVMLAGKLIRLRDFTTRQVEDAIKKALEQSGINSLAKLKELNEFMEKVKAEGYSNADFLNDLKTLVGLGTTLAGGVDIGVIFDILTYLECGSDKVSYLDAALDFGTFSLETAQTISDYQQGIEPRASATSFNVLDKVYNRIDLAQKAYKSWDVFQRAKARKDQHDIKRVAVYTGIWIGRFYTALNNALRAMKGSSVWTLRVEGVGALPYWYEGDKCKKLFGINMELEKNTLIPVEYHDNRRDIAGYEGVYTGWLNSRIVFDMSAWDANYIPETLQKAVSTDNVVRMFAFMHREWEKKGVLENYEYDHKRTQAVINMKLPVKVTIKKSNDDSELVYSSPYLLQNEPWIEEEGLNDIPEIERDITFQMYHKSRGLLTDGKLGFNEWAREIYYPDKGIIERRVAQIGDPNNVTKQSDGAQAFFATIFNGLFSTETNKEETVDLSRFTGSPMGTVKVYVKKSISNIDWGSDNKR